MKTTIKLDRNAFLAWQESLGEEGRIEISHAILNEFAKKHIKALENSSPIKDYLEQTREILLDTARDEIEKEIGIIKNEKFGYSTQKRFHLNPEFKQMLEKELDSFASQKKNQILRDLQKDIDAKLEDTNQRFMDLIDARFQEYEKNLEKKMANHFNAILRNYLTLGTEG